MRLVIHAGFAKCGSSSIQDALQEQQQHLRKHSVFLFGQHLLINRRAGSPPVRIWKVTEALRGNPDAATISRTIAEELKALAASRPDATAVLTSEVLGLPRSARLLAGIDADIDTTVVFYVRPQFEWIASAWKQWPLKQGMPLKDFADRSVAAHRPDFLRSLVAWSSALPQATLVVRVLSQGIAESGTPSADFFRILGLEEDPSAGKRAQVNPSFDFAILHTLMRNSWLFRDKHDNAIFDRLAAVLPPRYHAANIKMLPYAVEQEIAARFRADNMRILSTYAGLSDADAQEVYDAHLAPRDAGPSYLELDELAIAYRALGILLDALMDSRPDAVKTEAARRDRRGAWQLLISGAKRLIDGR